MNLEEITAICQRKLNKMKMQSIHFQADTKGADLSVRIMEVSVLKKWNLD